MTPSGGPGTLPSRPPTPPLAAEFPTPERNVFAMNERGLRLRLAGVGGALAAVLALGVFGPVRTLGADVVQTSDGKWFGLPEARAGEPPMPVIGPDDIPGDEMLAQSENFKLDATYETVKSNSGFSKSAGLIKRFRSVDEVRNEAFRQGLAAATSGYWKDAAESFKAAGGSTQGLGKQMAMWFCATAYAALGVPDETETAITELLAAFPKSYYFADAQILRAKIALQKGDVAAAAKALAAVPAEKGMNARDLYRAEYTRINFTIELQRKYDEARVAYQKLVDTIARGDATQGEIAGQQANVGIGNCYLAARKAKEAEPFFTKAIESRNADVLAGAYAGLGDIAQLKAQELAEGTNKDLKGAKEKLEEACLSYLRVTIYYKDTVEDNTPVLRALQNQGQVYFLLFDFSGGKDTEMYERGYNSYFELWKNMPEGSPKRAIQKIMADKKKAAGK